MGTLVLKMSESNIQNRVVNNILLLYLIDRTNSTGSIEDTLKLQKLVYLTQKRMIEKKLKLFTYNFFRWDKGPFSADVNNDLTVLSCRGLIRKRWPIRLTKEGKKLLNGCKELLEENEQFLKVIDDITAEFSEYTPEQIKEYTYNLSIFVPRLRQVMTVAEVPHGTLILFKPSDNRSKKKFILDESWLATLELALDQEAVESLKQSYSDAVEGNVHEFRTL